jgi:acyl-coenzyme A synthetase/AMP-(fatty) acid ligase
MKMPEKLAQALVDSLAQHPTALLADRWGSYTYSELEKNSRKWTTTLRTYGVEPGNLVGLRAGNSRQFVEVFMSILRHGARPVLIDPSLHDHELALLLQQCGIRFVLSNSPIEGWPTEVLDSWILSRISITQQAPQPRSTTEFCRLTSGSTRLPACIEFTGDAGLNAAASWSEAANLTKRDTILCLAGLYNGLAFNTTLIPGLLAGASLILWSGHPTAREFAHAIELSRPTVVVAFPAAYESLSRWTQSGRGISVRPRLALSSAAKLSDETRLTLQDAGISIGDYWGIAETGPITFNDGSLPAQGYPLPGVFIQRESESAYVRTESMGTCYLNYPGELESRISENGYLRTADVIDIDEAGAIHIRGRSDRAIEIGGRKFQPAAIESALERIGGIDDVCVLQRGGVLCAAYVSTSGELDRGELGKAASEVLAAYKVPNKFVRVSHIPKNGAGKVALSALRALMDDTEQFEMSNER